MLTITTLWTSLKTCFPRWSKNSLAALSSSIILTLRTILIMWLKLISLLPGEESLWWKNLKNASGFLSRKILNPKKLKYFMMNNARSTMLIVQTPELLSDWLTNWLENSWKVNVWTQLSSPNILSLCLLWPNIIVQNLDWLKGSSFSSSIWNSVMLSLNSTILSSRKICSCSKSKKRKKEMTKACSMMKTSWMP